MSTQIITDGLTEREVEWVAALCRLLSCYNRGKNGTTADMDAASALFQFTASGVLTTEILDGNKANPERARSTLLASAYVADTAVTRRVKFLADATPGILNEEG